MVNIKARYTTYMALSAFLFTFIIFFPCHAFALGGGGFRNEAALDAEANGMADAFVAQADSPSAVHFNPAGLTQLKGNYIRVGNTTQAPRNSHTSTSGNESQMQRQLFFIPNLYFASDFGLENWRFGLGVTSPYGLGTDWADDSFSQFQATESNLEVYQINPTVAYKVNDVISLGFGIDYVVSYISNHKRHTIGGGDYHLSGDDDGWGYNVGLLMRPSDNHSIGLSYRSKIKLTYRGLTSLDGLNPLNTFIFGGSSYSTAVESKLTLPRSLAVGYAFKPDEKWTIEIDCDWTDWSSVEEDFATYPDESAPLRIATLNSGNPAAKDWNDSFAYGIGAEYKATDKLTLRSGYLFIETPIPSANFETALPDSDKHCVTFGVGYKINDGLTIDAAYFGVFAVDRDVTNDVASSSSDLDGEYEGYANIFSAGFTYRY